MKKFAVIGLGKFGFHVAKSLFESGNEVVAIDSRKPQVQAIDPFSTEAMVLDATDKEALDALGLILSIGTDISNSILICLHLQEIGVPNIVAKALDKDHEKILTRVGATRVIHPERDMAIRLSRNLSQPNVLDFIPLADEFDLIQVEPPEKFIGKSLADLHLRAKYNVHVIAVKESGEKGLKLIPPAGYVIRESDVLMLLGKPDDVSKIKALK